MFCNPHLKNILTKNDKNKKAVELIKNSKQKIKLKDRPQKLSSTLNIIFLPEISL